MSNMYYKKWFLYLIFICFTGIFFILGTLVISEEAKNASTESDLTNNKKTEKKHENKEIKDSVKNKFDFAARTPEEIADNQSKHLKEQLGLDVEKENIIKDIILNNEKEKRSLQEKIRGMESVKDDKIKSVLNDEQKAKFISIIEKNKKVNKSDKEKENEVKDQKGIFSEIIKDPELKEAERIQLQKILKNYRDDIKSINEVTSKDFLELLTPEQKSIMTKSFENPKNRVGSKTGYVSNSPDLSQTPKNVTKPITPKIFIINKENMEKYSQKLNLSPEQKGKSAKIIENKESDIKSAKEFAKQDIQKSISPEMYKKYEDKINKIIE